MADEKATVELQLVSPRVNLQGVRSAIEELRTLDALLETVTKRRVSINLAVTGGGELRASAESLEHLVATLRAAGSPQLAESVRRGLMTPAEAARQAQREIANLNRELQVMHRGIGVAEARYEQTRRTNPKGLPQGAFVLDLAKQQEGIMKARGEMDALLVKMQTLSRAAGMGEGLRGVAPGKVTTAFEQQAKAVEKVTQAEATQATVVAKDTAALEAQSLVVARKAELMQKLSTSVDRVTRAEAQQEAQVRKTAAAEAGAATAVRRPGLLSRRTVIGDEGEVVTNRFRTGAGAMDIERDGQLVGREYNQLAQLRQRQRQIEADFAGRHAAMAKAGTGASGRGGLLSAHADELAKLFQEADKAGLGGDMLGTMKRSEDLRRRAGDASIRDTERADKTKSAEEDRALRDANRRAKQEASAWLRDQEEAKRRSLDIEKRFNQELARAGQQTEKDRAAASNRAVRDAEERAKREAAAWLREQEAARRRALDIEKRFNRELARVAAEREREANKPGLGQRFMQNTGKVALWSASVGALYTGVGMAQNAVGEALDVDRKYATLRAVFRGTREEARGLMDDVVKLAAVNGRSADEAMDAAVRWSRLGLARAEATEAVRVSLMAANVAEIDAADAAEHLSAIYVSYRLNAAELIGVLDQLNEVSNTMNVTNKDLLEGISRVGALAKQAGLPLSQLVGLIGAGVSATARTGAEMGNALKSLTVALANPETQRFLQGTFGMNVKTPVGEMKDMASILRELYELTRGMSRAETGELLVRVAGKQQASRVQALLDNYLEAQKQAVVSQRELNSASEENDKILASTLAKWHQLQTRITNAAHTMWQSGVGDLVNAGLDAGPMGLVGAGLVGKGAWSMGRGVLKGTGANLRGNVPMMVLGGMLAGSSDETLNDLLGVATNLITLGPLRGKGFTRGTENNILDRMMGENVLGANKSYATAKGQLEVVGNAMNAIGAVTRSLDSMSASEAKAALRQVATMYSGDTNEQGRISGELQSLYAAANLDGVRNRLLEMQVSLRERLAKAQESERLKMDRANATDEATIAMLEQRLQYQNLSPEERGSVERKIEDLRQSTLMRKSGRAELAQYDEDASLFMYAGRETLGTKMDARLAEFGAALQAIPGLGERVDQVRARRAALGAQDVMARTYEDIAQSGFYERPLRPEETAFLKSQAGLIRMRNEVEREGLSRQERDARLLDTAIGGEREGRMIGAFYGASGSTETSRLLATGRGIARGGFEEVMAGRSAAGTDEERARAEGRLIGLGNQAIETRQRLLEQELRVRVRIAEAAAEENREASKALLMASREDQLRAALLARRQRDGRKLDGEAWQFLSQDFRGAAVRFAPGAVPDSLALTRQGEARAELEEFQARGASVLEELDHILEHIRNRIDPTNIVPAALPQGKVDMALVAPDQLQAVIASLQPVFDARMWQVAAAVQSQVATFLAQQGAATAAAQQPGVDAVLSTR